MAIKKHSKKLDKTVLWLFVVALIIEIVNTFISLKLGATAANQCPRSSSQQTISILISLLSIAVIVAAIIKRRKSLTFAYGIFAIALIVCWAFILWLFASGGLDWCDYHF